MVDRFPTAATDSLATERKRRRGIRQTLNVISTPFWAGSHYDAVSRQRRLVVGG